MCRYLLVDIVRRGQCQLGSLDLVKTGLLSLHRATCTP